MPLYLQALLMEAALAIARPLMKIAADAVMKEVIEVVEDVEIKTNKLRNGEFKKNRAVREVMTKKQTGKMLPGYYQITPEQRGVAENILGVLVDGVVQGKNKSRQFEHKEPTE